MQPIRSTADVPFLQARNVSKSFVGVSALADVSLAVRAGEVHALMGENGAGKSTFMKVLAGVHPPDSGEILLGGRTVVLRGPHEAIRNGIAMIHQELMPIPDLTVAENILLGHEPAFPLLGWIDRRAVRSEGRRLLDLLQVNLPLTQMRHLSVAEMQTVEIVKALGRNAGVLIMDEPTAAISPREVDALFDVITMLKRRGAAIVFVSHKLDEVFRIADTITVLRDGSRVGTYKAAELGGQKLIALMVGRPLESIAPRPAASLGEPALCVQDLTRRGAFRDVSLEVRRGEILGVTGLMGAGRTELASAIFGLAPADSGEIRVAGRPVRIRCPADAIRFGIGMVTEDRKKFGLVPTMSVRHNLTLAALGDCCLGPFIRPAKEAAAVEAGIRTFAVKTKDPRQRVAELSGGNQQKVVIARSLLARPSIIILDEPTRGIDVAAKAEIHALVVDLARQGKAVILVSSELPEVLALSDRLLVMRQGSVTAELRPSSTSQEEILKYAMPI